MVSASVTHNYRCYQCFPRDFHTAPNANCCSSPLPRAFCFTPSVIFDAMLSSDSGQRIALAQFHETIQPSVGSLSRSPILLGPLANTEYVVGPSLSPTYISLILFVYPSSDVVLEISLSEPVSLFSDIQKEKNYFFSSSVFTFSQNNEILLLLYPKYAGC